MKIIVAWTAFFLALSAPVAAKLDRTPGAVAPAELISPTEDTVVPPGGLEFRWNARGASLDYSDFRLYRGAETVESNLILKERVDRAKTTFVVPAATFENGKTYAWSVRLVGRIKKSTSTRTLFTVKEGGTNAGQNA